MVAKLETSLTPTSKAVLRFVNVVRAFDVWVSSLAMRFASIVIRVFPMRDCPKMIGVHASAITTDVIHFFSIRDTPIKYLKRDKVGFNALTVALNSAVSLLGKARSPQPASCFPVQLKLFYEAIKQWSIGRHRSVLFDKGWRWHHGVNLIHLFLLSRPIYRKSNNHLRQSFLKGKYLSMHVRVTESAHKHIIHGDVVNWFRNAIESLAVFLLVHNRKSLRPDRRTDGTGFRRSQNAGKEVFTWNGCTMAMSL